MSIIRISLHSNNQLLPRYVGPISECPAIAWAPLTFEAWRAISAEIALDMRTRFVLATTLGAVLIEKVVVS